MIKKIFTCFDQKAQLYTRPFFYVQLAEALRSFSDCANDQAHEIGRHPSDYTLMEIGTFDETTATIVAYDTPKAHGTAVEYLTMATHPHQIDLNDQQATPPE